MSGIVTWAEANTYLLVLILAVGTGIAVFLGFRQMAEGLTLPTACMKTSSGSLPDLLLIWSNAR